jgi:acyl carrier protein
MTKSTKKGGMEGTPDMPATTSEVNLMARLLTVCEQQGLFSTEDGPPDVDEDLIEGRGVDSMGLTYLQAIIEQEFSVDIPLPMLASELRSIRSIAAYLAERLAASSDANVRIR